MSEINKLEKCPDCGGTLEQGAVIDLGFGSLLIQKYGRLKDFPRMKEWMTMWGQDFKFKELEEVRRVITYRCISCSRLFPYTADPVLDKDMRNQKSVVLSVALVIIAIAIVFALVLGLI